jgi:hypothetical protein
MTYITSTPRRMTLQKVGKTTIYNTGDFAPAVLTYPWSPAEHIRPLNQHGHSQAASFSETLSTYTKPCWCWFCVLRSVTMRPALTFQSPGFSCSRPWEASHLVGFPLKLHALEFVLQDFIFSQAGLS